MIECRPESLVLELPRAFKKHASHIFSKNEKPRCFLQIGSNLKSPVGNWTSEIVGVCSVQRPNVPKAPVELAVITYACRVPFGALLPRAVPIAALAAACNVTGVELAMFAGGLARSS